MLELSFMNESVCAFLKAGRGWGLDRTGHYKYAVDELMMIQSKECAVPFIICLQLDKVARKGDILEQLEKAT